MSEHKEIANTILAQLGGSRFIIMTGAKNLIFLNEKRGGLQFSLKAKKINKVRIILNDNDLYDIEFGFYASRKFTYSVVKSVENIGAEQLVNIFEETTGLFTSF